MTCQGHLANNGTRYHLLKTYHMPNTAKYLLYTVSYSSQKILIGTVTISISQKRKLRLRLIIQLAQEREGGRSKCRIQTNKLTLSMISPKKESLIIS